MVKENSYPEMDVLFRGKMGTGHWVEGFFYKDPESDVRNSYIIVKDFEFKQIKGFTLCEFTRFFDKKFKKIFTHDIIMDTVTEEVGEVLFVDGSFCVKYLLGNTVPLTHKLVSRIEIMSNTIDKPDLLNKLGKAFKKEDKKNVKHE